MTTCLVTGGAGFIGCAVSGRLADRFDTVVAFDNLHPQVHATAERPAALDDRVELVRGDVTEADDWRAMLATVRPVTVLHLAAETGTAQSLTESSRHASVNVLGTTRMLDAFVEHDIRPDRIVLTSSRAVYGEGAWRSADGQLHYPGQRTHAMLTSGEWDFPGLTPQPAHAAYTQTRPTSVYGATKLAQEHLVSAWCLAMGVAPVILRLQNVYGAGQSPTNPYTGIVVLFAQLARAGKAIPVYEDGSIVRDFVHVDDVAAALELAVALDGPALVDVGSGVPTTVAELAARVARAYAAPEPRVTGQYREGDVRYACVAPGAGEALGWAPSVGLDEGLAGLFEWLGQRSDAR